MIIEYYLPAQVLSNKDLEEQFPNWPADKVEAKIGVRERHIAADGETALDMACLAATKAFKDYDRNLIDFVLLCTQSPDYHLPTSACILQDKLGLSTHIGALDLNLGCSGFIYGLAMAKSLIIAGVASNVLLCTAETYSKYLHPNDYANRSIFGDGSAAVIIDKDDAARIYEFDMGTDGRGMGNLIVAAGGARSRREAGCGVPIEDPGQYLFMNGPEIFNFTISCIPPLYSRTLEKNGLHINDIDYVIFHQANKYMLDYLRKKIRIPIEKFYNNMLHYGNTVSSTIPIALKDCMDGGTIKQGQKILLVGFGVGYSWGGTVIQI